MKALFLAFPLISVLAAQAENIVWNSNQVIDKTLVMKNVHLKIEKGVRIQFKGEGRLSLDYGSFSADGADFQGEGTLEQDFRISIQNAKVRIENCHFSGIKSKNPMKYVSGSTLIRFGAGAELRNNTFNDCSAAAFVNTKNVAVEKNRFEKSEGGVFLFHASESRIANNVFEEMSGNAIELNSANLNTVEKNRFLETATSVKLWWSGKCVFSGNSMFGGGTGFHLWGAGAGNLFTGNLFEKIKGYAFTSSITIASGNIFSNNVIYGAAAAFAFPETKPEVEIIVRNNAIVNTGIGILSNGGKVQVSNCLFWQLKHDFIRKGNAVIDQQNILKADPLFKNPEESDYRPAEGSPLLKNGTPPGSNIGLFQ